MTPVSKERSVDRSSRTPGSNRLRSERGSSKFVQDDELIDRRTPGEAHLFDLDRDGFRSSSISATTAPTRARHSAARLGSDVLVQPTRLRVVALGRAIGSWADLVVEVGGLVDVVQAETAEARVGAHLFEEFGVKAKRAEPRTAELGQRG